MPIDIPMTPNTDSFQRTPLTRFRGTLKDINLVKNERFNSQRAVFDFTDVTVIESTEPYPFPIATIEVNYRPDGKDNPWDVWKKSVYSAFGDEDYGTMLDRLVGKEQEWWYGDAMLRRTANENAGEEPDKDEAGKDIWRLRPSKAWQVTWIEGAGGAKAAGGKGLNELLAELANGKDKTGFNTALFSPDANPLKSFGVEFTKAVEVASKSELLPALVTIGLLSVDSDGVYHKV